MLQHLVSLYAVSYRGSRCAVAVCPRDSAICFGVAMWLWRIETPTSGRDGAGRAGSLVRWSVYVRQYGQTLIAITSMTSQDKYGAYSM